MSSSLTHSNDSTLPLSLGSSWDDLCNDDCSMMSLSSSSNSLLGSGHINSIDNELFEILATPSSSLPDSQNSYSSQYKIKYVDEAYDELIRANDHDDKKDCGDNSDSVWYLPNHTLPQQHEIMKPIENSNDIDEANLSPDDDNENLKQFPFGANWKNVQYYGELEQRTNMNDASSCDQKPWNFNGFFSDKYEGVENDQISTTLAFMHTEKMLRSELKKTHKLQKNLIKFKEENKKLKQKRKRSHHHSCSRHHHHCCKKHKRSKHM